MSDKLTASSCVDPSAKTISVPVFHLYHKLLPGTRADVRVRSHPPTDTSRLLPSVTVCCPPPPLQVSPSHPR